MRFFTQLYNSWKDYNRQSVARSPCDSRASCQIYIHNAGLIVGCFDRTHSTSACSISGLQPAAGKRNRCCSPDAKWRSRCHVTSEAICRIRRLRVTALQRYQSRVDTASQTIADSPVRQPARTNRRHYTFPLYIFPPHIFGSASSWRHPAGDNILSFRVNVNQFCPEFPNGDSD